MTIDEAKGQLVGWLSNHRNAVNVILAFAAGTLFGFVNMPKSKVFQSTYHSLSPDSPQLRRINTAYWSQISPMDVSDVHVSSMCRCPSGSLPVPVRMQSASVSDVNVDVDDEQFQDLPAASAFNPFGTPGYDTRVIQPPSKATGPVAKRFVHHPLQTCNCVNNHESVDRTNDIYMSRISATFFRSRCPNSETQSSWKKMPDFGVEESLPVFVGVLSYESPLSLNKTLHNWLEHDFFHKIGARDVMVQLNHRSKEDDAVLGKFQKKLQGYQRPPLNIMGDEHENLNPGVAISKFCRMAEQHPNSHPNGENVLVFLEKDWHIRHIRGYFREGNIGERFRSANALLQRGVDFVRLMTPVAEVAPEKVWNCPSEGMPWWCTTAHQHRWSNQPFVMRCDWFLRYLEPFALFSMEDPIMNGCRQSFQESGYCDWEQAMQDGRVAWTNAQWVMASLAGEWSLFKHEEVDQ